MNSNMKGPNKKANAKSSKTVKFLLAPRSQKDPLAADYEAPQHVLVPKDGTDIEEIKQRLPDFDPCVFASKEETKTGMLERAHNSDGINLDTDLLKAMSKDFDFDDPNNVLDDDFMDQAGGLIEEEGELLDEDMDNLMDELFEDEPEIITFNHGKDNGSDDCSVDSDDYDVDEQQKSNQKDDLDWQDVNDEKKDDMFGYGKRLILFKKKANKPQAMQSKATSQQSNPANIDKSAKQLEAELNAQFKPEAQRLLTLKGKKLSDNPESDSEDAECDDDDTEEDEEEDDEFEAKTVFTNYSMTSSVMRRSQGLQQIDEHFERLFEKEYADDTEIGALDLNEVKGDELLTNIDQIRQLKKEIKAVRMRNHGDDYEPEIVSDHHKNAIIGDDPAAEDEDLVEVEIQRRENRVDCESILTYNSNLYNHPKLIVEPRKKSASQSTENQMEVESIDARSRSGRGQSIASSRATVLSKLSVRPTDETPEARKARKKALKAYRHERRQERKQNQQVFKSEHANLVKQQRTNMPALKLA